MNRSRGLGNVKCTIENIKECKDNTIEDIGNDENIVKLEYVIENIRPLILSGKNDSKSENFISGKNIIGALAEMYVKMGKNTDDTYFYDLFINGNVKYSNLYITGKEYNRKDDEYIYRKHIPAPLFINRLKKSKKIVNVTKDYSKNGAEYNPNNGNQPKKLKNKFIALNDGKISVKEPLLNIVYHHSRNLGENNNLYTLEVIRENQYFSGTIIGKKKYIDFIVGLLENNVLRFGKSKSAQYGECIIIKKEIKKYDFKADIKKGEKIVVYFESDAVFQNENGFTAKGEDIKKLTADYLGIKYDKYDVNDMFLQSETVVGYNTVWNLKKPSFPCISAGSTIIYSVVEDSTIKSEYVGVKNAEGYGNIKIYKFNQLCETYNEYSCDNKKIEPMKCLKLIEKILFKDFEDSMKESSIIADKIDISASTIGRVTLMLNESVNNYKYDYKKAFDDFKSRINSIKRKDEKYKIGVFITNYLCKDREFSFVKDSDLTELEIDINKIIGNEDSDSRKIYNRIKELKINNVEEKIEMLWGKYLKNILVYQKYAKKEG